MNGQLSEQPLAELIREISQKSLGGSLRLQHDRIKVVAYFRDGIFVYAASNLRTLRLREYLQKGSIVSEQELARFDDRRSDVELAKTLYAENLLAPSDAEQIQIRQVSDVLRLAFLWTEGAWEFDHRSTMSEEVGFKVDADSLLLDAGRRVPLKFAASRFRNPRELISPVMPPPANDSLLPTEVFLLSRLDRPMVLAELVALSGLEELETLRVIYSLALAGLLQREHWKYAFRSHPSKTQTKNEAATKPEATEHPTANAVGSDDINNFLQRVANAQSHYDVLAVGKSASPEELKSVYYELARRYHPDRFRKAEPSLRTLIESAFARITQAYDTLRDERHRSTYDSKLDVKARAQQLADSAPKAAAPVAPAAPTANKVAESGMSAAERAELRFKEGFAALELGQRNVAIGLFAAAVGAVPNEPRYRAYYGRVLASHESTRRAAEVELQAAVKLDPKNAEYRVLLAELYRDLGFMVRARGEAERAVASDPNNRKARDLLHTLK